MKRLQRNLATGALTVALSIGIGFYFWNHQVLNVLPISAAQAAGGKVTDPNGVAPDRYVYYPGTEDLAKAFKKAHGMK